MVSWAFAQPEFNIQMDENLSIEAKQQSDVLRAQYFLCSADDFKKKFEYHTTHEGKYKNDGFYFIDVLNYSYIKLFR